MVWMKRVLKLKLHTFHRLIRWTQNDCSQQLRGSAFGTISPMLASEKGPSQFILKINIYKTCRNYIGCCAGWRRGEVGATGPTLHTLASSGRLIYSSPHLRYIIYTLPTHWVPCGTICTFHCLGVQWLCGEGVGSWSQLLLSALWERSPRGGVMLCKYLEVNLSNTWEF